MNTEYMLLGLYGKPRLSLDDVCNALGISRQTVYNQRCAKTFPIEMTGNPLTADIRDVAAHLDAMRSATDTLKAA